MTKTSVHQRKARDFIQREDWQNALSELERMLGTDAGNPTLHNQIGDVFLRKDEVQRAVEHFEAAIDLYATVGLHNNAVALCKKIMRLRPGRVEIRYRLAKLRLDQGFRSEAAAFFREYLEHASVSEDAAALEQRCREMFDLLAGEAPIGLLLEKLEGAQRFVAAFEIVRTLAQRAADAGDDAGANRFGEKMRSLRVLVERSGGRDLLADSGAGAGAVNGYGAASARATYEPNVVDLDGEAAAKPAAPAAAAELPVEDVQAPAVLNPGVPPLAGLAAEGAADGVSDATAAVERLAHTAESVASDVFGLAPLPDLDLDLTLGDAPEPAHENAGMPFDFSPGFSLAPPDDGAFEIDLNASLDGFEPAHAFDPAPVDTATPAFEPVDEPAAAFDDGELQLPPGVRLIAPVDDAPPLGQHAFDGAEDVFAAPMNGTAPDAPFDLGLDSESDGAYFGDLAAALDATTAAPVAPAPYAPPAATAPAPVPAPAPAARRDWAMPEMPHWDPASLAPPPEPVAPAAAMPPVNEWVDELRRSPVWIPTGDTLTGPDPTRPDRGLSMELESVIDSFREQMSRALDGDGSARYDLGVAYYDMGLYNEALAEFDAASKSPGLEVQSYEMLAQCLLQTGRHAEVLELLLPVIAADGHAPRGKIGLQFCLGLAYEGLGDPGQARRHYEEVALVDVDFKDVQNRLLRI